MGLLQIPNSPPITGAVIFKGAWDASAGTFPGAGVAQQGWQYRISVGGTVDGVVFTVGDDILAIANNASASTYASNWLKGDNTEEGGGSSGPAWPKTAYVETTGNNGTAVIGDPALPFLTPQAAYTAIRAAAAGQYVIRCGVGSFGGITLSPSGTGTLIGIYGVTSTLSSLVSIYGTGANGSAGGEDGPGGVGSSGVGLIVNSDYSIHLGEINLDGGNGGAGGSPTSVDTTGGAGGTCGSITLRNVVAGPIQAVGGGGGPGGNYSGSDTGGDGGAGNNVDIIGLVCTALTLGPGNGGGGSISGSSGAPGTINISGIACNGALFVSAGTGSGSYVQGYAQTKTVSEAADAVLPS